VDASLQAPLWRSIAVFRFASLGYAAILLVLRRENYAHWGLAWAIIAAMTMWTVATTIVYTWPVRRTRGLLAADLLVTSAALLSTALVQTAHATAVGAMPVTATWLAGPALAWAVAYGSLAGAAAAALIGLCDVFLQHENLAVAYHSTSLDGPILLIMAAVVVGYIAKLSTRAEQALQRATEIEAASRERERLARSIHDSVLQVLAMVQRRGAEAGGAAAEIGRLAGDQEKALRALVLDDAQPSPAGELDLSAELTRLSSAQVAVITPAPPVLLPEAAVRETAAAVRASLDNVRQHCGERARAWVLVDDEGDAVSVTIRDDGPGIPAGRLTEAASEGRLGVSQSIKGRMRDLGGAAEIDSAPGAGTQVRLRLPRAPKATARGTHNTRPSPAAAP
jgi:signal transduction histidine kinase